MFSLEQIKNEYPENISQIHIKNLLVEYLQYELLDSIYKQKGSEKLSFIGGTAIRIVYGTQRFSEDLDFDNFGLSYKHFSELLEKVVVDMGNKGFKIEYRFIEKGAYHCYIKFPEILFNNNLSDNEDEKILIRVDSVRKDKLVESKTFLLNRFGVYRRIIVNTESVILVQKIIAILERKRTKGRDFYDVSFLLGITSPDYEYLEKVKNINREDFKNKLLRKVDEINLSELACDVQPFLINPDEIERVLSFREFIEQKL
jgi:predicted nucleotidyltransferase component of viral defense system